MVITIMNIVISNVVTDFHYGLQVLSGQSDSPDLPENVNWVSRAMMVYRQGLSHGLQPSLKVLDRLLSCLRLPFIPPLAHGLPTHTTPPQHKV